MSVDFVLFLITAFAFVGFVFVLFEQSKAAILLLTLFVITTCWCVDAYITQTPRLVFTLKSQDYQCNDGKVVQFIVIYDDIESQFRLVNLNEEFKKKIPSNTSVVVEKIGGYSKGVIFYNVYRYTLP